MGKRRDYTPTMEVQIIKAIQSYDWSGFTSRKEILSTGLEIMNSDKSFPRRLSGEAWTEHYVKRFLDRAGVLSQVPDGRSGEVPKGDTSKAIRAARKAARIWLRSTFNLPIGNPEIKVSDRERALAAREILTDLETGKVMIPEGETLISMAAKIQAAHNSINVILGR